MRGVPEASVVIPTRNRASLLADSLGAALGQEDVELEVIVVDDGSTDGTREQLAAIDDPRLRAVRYEQGGGVARARNRGIREARGEWIAFLDDDDLWSPRKLRTQLDALAGSGAQFCYAAAVVIDDERSEVTADAPVPDPENLRERLLVGNAIPGGGSNVIASTDLVRAVGGFDERLSIVEDWDLWCRLADQGRAVACQEVLVAYRRHRQNMTRVDVGHMERVLDYFASKQLAERGMRFDRVGYSRWLAREAATPLAAARIYAHAGVLYRNPRNFALALAALVGARAARPAQRTVVPEPEWLRQHRRGC